MDEDVNLTNEENLVYSAVLRWGNLCPSQLSMRVGIGIQSATTVLKSLKRKGLVRTVTDHPVKNQMFELYEPNLFSRKSAGNISKPSIPSSTPESVSS